MADGLPIELEFAGGAELLIKEKKKKHNISLPSSKSDQSNANVRTLGDLLSWIKENLISERPELLIANGNTVRPGILVLINDTDWELLGESTYVLQPNDKITLISTLHGG